MEFCIWGLSFLACGTKALFSFILGFFMPPNIPPMIYFLILLIFSSVVIYLIGLLLGKIGGMILAVVGIVGALVTGGLSLVLTLIGFIMIFLGDPKMLVLLNFIFFMLCSLCYGF